jgi:ferrous iron transport protein A
VKSSDTKTASITLTDLRRGDLAVVTGLDGIAAPGAEPADSELLISRLRDLGFVPGARCEVVARMWPGGDPVAVRIGGSTFALRRAEAAAVRVQRLLAESAHTRPASGNPRAAIA